MKAIDINRRCAECDHETDDCVKFTTKDYEKAYKEALERAKDFMNGEVHYELKMGENIMCWIFPELRESEDERIRKEIIDYITYVADTRSNKKEWLAWLEKQGAKDELIKELGKILKLNVFKRLLNKD